MQTEKTSAYAAAVRAGLRRAFAPRDFILRGNGRVRYVRLGLVAQIILAPIALSAFGGAGWLAWRAATMDDRNAALTAEAEAARLDYLNLLRDVAAFEDSLSGVDVASGEAREQAAMARESLRQRLANDEVSIASDSDGDAALTEEIASLRAQLSADDAARAEMRAARETMQARIETLTAELRAEREAAAIASDRIAALDVAAVEATQRIEDLSQARDDLTGQLEKKTAAHVLASETADANAAALAATTEERDALRASLEATTVERDERMVERDEARRTVTAMEDRILDLEAGLAEAESVIIAAVDARMAAETDSVAAGERATSTAARMAEMDAAHTELFTDFAKRAETNAKPMERAIAMTGVDIRALIDRETLSRRGQGGPYLATARALNLSDDLQKAATGATDALSRLEALRAVMRVLPLDAPLDQYRVTSSFGRRVDPINGGPAMHYGLDMVAPTKTPIYATSPGKVTFAGWKGNYGRFVEIDHGKGVRTRYGHLHKILVRPGQRVDFREKVGLLGNSGRSTGPHLHYEVKVRGKPLNPQKFISAGRHVLKDG